MYGIAGFVKDPEILDHGLFSKNNNIPNKSQKARGEHKRDSNGMDPILFVFLSRTLVVVVFATLDGFSFDPRGRVKNQQN